MHNFTPPLRILCKFASLSVVNHMLTAFQTPFLNALNLVFVLCLSRQILSDFVILYFQSVHFDNPNVACPLHLFRPVNFVLFSFTRVSDSSDVSASYLLLF